MSTALQRSGRIVPLLAAIALAACQPGGASPRPAASTRDPAPSQVAPHVEPSRPPETPIATMNPIAPHVEPSRPPETPIATLGDDS